MLAALSTSSTPMRIDTALRRVDTVSTPSANTIAPTIRKCTRPTLNKAFIATLRGAWLVFGRAARDDHGADQRHQENHRRQFERQQVLAQERVAQARRGRRGDRF